MDQSIAPATMSSKNEQKHGEQSSSGNRTPTKPAMRKGPWTEEEDAQLVWFVRFFGERRWDFLAKVSGLKRTGKSCRLRWVNYLHPGLRRGSITPDEERLILQLHEQWGSRWSRIARSLPGRTDNEIKNYWRTRTRKQKAHQENRNKTASSSSSSLVTSCSGSPSGGSGTATSSSAATESALQESSGDEDAELDEASTTAASQHHHQRHQPQQLECYTLDQLWNEIAATEVAASYAVDSWGATGHPATAAEPSMPSSPVWEYCSDYSLWRIDDEEYYKKMLDAS